MVFGLHYQRLLVCLANGYFILIHSCMKIQHLHYFSEPFSLWKYLSMQFGLFEPFGFAVTQFHLFRTTEVLSNIKMNLMNHWAVILLLVFVLINMTVIMIFCFWIITICAKGTRNEPKTCSKNIQFTLRQWNIFQINIWPTISKSSIVIMYIQFQMDSYNKSFLRYIQP